MKWHKEIEVASALVPLDNITNFEDDNEPGQFVVQSQSNSNLIYFVDVDAYTCDREAYLLISYCKHPASIQLHFYEKFKFKPMDSLCSNMDTIPACTTAPGYEMKAVPSQVPMVLSHLVLPASHSFHSLSMDLYILSFILTSQLHPWPLLSLATNADLMAPSCALAGPAAVHIQLKPSLVDCQVLRGHQRGAEENWAVCIWQVAVAFWGWLLEWQGLDLMGSA